MILTKFVNIKMNAKWISIYRNMGYQCNVGDIIEAIDNICITKGYINSRKCKLTEEEFVEKLRVNYAY